jgi:hypothetical protein
LNKPCDQLKADKAGPKDGSWPPGYDVNGYRTIAVTSAAAPGEGVVETAPGGRGAF